MLVLPLNCKSVMTVNSIKAIILKFLLSRTNVEAKCRDVTYLLRMIRNRTSVFIIMSNKIKRDFISVREKIVESEPKKAASRFISFFNSNLKYKASKFVKKMLANRIKFSILLTIAGVAMNSNFADSCGKCTMVCKAGTCTCYNELDFKMADCFGTCTCRNGGICDKNQKKCRCQPGWTGVICESKCQPGRFGENCTQTCECFNGANCDHVTGKTSTVVPSSAAILIYFKATASANQA